MNRIILIGNLTRNPEHSIVNGDLSVAKFTVAVSRRFNKDEVDFINVVAWRKLADNCSAYLTKGSKVGVSGSLQIRSYEAQDGSRRYITEVVADEVEFLSTKEEKEEQEKAPITEIDDNDLPF